MYRSVALKSQPQVAPALIMLFGIQQTATARPHAPLQPFDTALDTTDTPENVIASLCLSSTLQL